MAYSILRYKLHDVHRIYNGCNLIFCHCVLCKGKLAIVKTFAKICETTVIYMHTNTTIFIFKVPTHHFPELKEILDNDPVINAHVLREPVDRDEWYMNTQTTQSTWIDDKIR